MSETTGEITTGTLSIKKMVTKNILWFVLGFFFLILFTIAKVPESRITNLIQGNLATVLAPMGITLSPEKTSFSSLFGPRYKMKNVRVYLPSPAKDFVVDEITVTPSLLSALTGSIGGTLRLRKDKGELSVSFSMNKTKYDYRFSLDNLDLGKLQLLPAFAKVSGGAIANGKGEGSGDVNNATLMKTDISLQLKNIQLDSQVLGGFNVPQINVSDGSAVVSGKNGKIEIKTLQLGHFDKPTDDLDLNATGELGLNANLNSSNLTMKGKVKPSEKVLKAFVLFDTFFGAGKQTDGSYLLQINGPLYAPIPTPVKSAS